MKSRPCQLFLRALTLLMGVASGVAAADTLQVAVASNFASTLAQIKPEFERRSGHSLVISAGSSGRHYAQIMHGAPFDLFLSADTVRTEALQRAGRVAPDQRRVYAIGRLALWSREAGLDLSWEDFPELVGSERLAIANPRLAPYGAAAVSALTATGRYGALQDRLVMGENVAQAFQFAYSRSARFALIAYAQVLASPEPGSFALVAADSHAPIRQEMVLLTDTEAARQLFDYLSSAAVASVLEQTGYIAPAPGS